MKKILRLLGRAAGYYVLFMMAMGLVYWIVPPVSTLMLGRLATFQGITYHPASLKKVSVNLTRTIIRAEDSRFCEHHGVDWNSLFDTIEEGGMEGPRRGASTISMQVAKNLFLWPQQSYVRKAVEIPLAMYLDLIWSKKRMMEVYLSVAEWGEGVYGAEAASRLYFHKPAASLTRGEAALLAAALPDPKDRNPNHPSEYYSGYAESLERWANSDVDISCLR
jgi:monofunctional biosynthetic peptidoglycan transglycosylase